jgi:hypothetical protein
MVPVPGRAAAALAAYLRDVRPELVVNRKRERSSSLLGGATVSAT